MRRTLFGALLVTTLAALAGCNNSTSGTDGGNTHDAGTGTDGGADGGGTITQVSHNNALPAPYMSSTASDFDQTNDGGAAAYVNALVEFTASGVSQGPDAGNVGCPAPLVYQTNCDGFQVNATGGSFLVDAYYYAGDPTACASLDNAATLSSVRGVWYDDYGAYAIAITACSDLGIGSPYGGTGTPPSTPAGSMTVSALLTSNPADGSTVIVSGLVVGLRNGGDTFTVALEDPSGGAHTATSVYKSDTSPSTAAMPAIGDYVTVTGTWSKQYQNISL
jgi:hypothetical protein